MMRNVIATLQYYMCKCHKLLAAEECFGLRFTQAETQCVTKYAVEMTEYKLVVIWEEKVLELIEERNILLST